MTVLYPKLCYNEVCYKGTALFFDQEKTVGGGWW